MTERAFSQTERLSALRLARSDGVGPVTFADLMQRFSSPAEALEALPDLARRAGRAGPLPIATAADAEAEIEAGEALGARLHILGETGYPAQLAATDGAPPVLWTRGRRDLTEAASVAVVGARIASAAGRRFARDLARDLGEAGFVIVSGMARGIDGAAHEGSLATGAVAVLAGGVDDIYPAEHRDLYERLIDDGAVVSERPPGQKARTQDFIRRNRIISGLARAVVVVEAELRSGSLTTARLAGEQGREVLAVPGSPLDPRARGANDLIRNGAALCEGPEDVLRALGTFRRLMEPAATVWAGAPSPPAETASRAEDADALRERLAALLSPTPVSRDELVRAANGPAPAVFAALMELSLAGRAEMLSGGLVVAA